jgi:tetratricopeptide (TPR) repeat protein
MAMGSRKNRRKKAPRSQQLGQHLLSLPKDSLPGQAQQCYAIGVELIERQQFHRAVSALKRAVELDPGSAPSWTELAFALGSAERLIDAHAAYARALELMPAVANIAARFGEMLVNCGATDEATAYLRRAIQLDPNCFAAHAQLCWVARIQGDKDAAISHGERAFDNHGDEVAGFYLALAYLAQDRFADALRVCDALLRSNPRSVRALTLKVSALNGLGRRAEGTGLADFERFVWSAEIRAPAPYRDLKNFNAELAKLVMRYPGRPHDPSQTLNIFDQPEPAARALAGVVSDAVSHYLNNLPNADSHVFLSNQPPNFTAEAWGTRLERYADAEHHFHQHAWISGVYYVELPEFVRTTNPADLDGCLEFCRFHSYSDNAVESDTMVIRPEPGLLVLFPAYAYHRVLKFQRPGRRISIAFNLLPSDT